MLKILRSILLILCLVSIPACQGGVSLELGTIGLRVNIAIDEWAQANVLKSLDEVVTAGIESLKDSEEETEDVQPQE